eukprot:TRINITY_DN368_c1_g2_i14.p1 TRINITY_DN368_c1_g2~~TRINITY_DN368_c1_g2_i14.p1  ORF type:complete len:259 (-),score=41.62 TRINITY_DN368_c1_g2_i14:406-1182(-)
MEETKQASVGTVVAQGVSITSGSTNVVWVKKVDEEDFNAEAFRFSPGCTISELKDILYASPKFALAPGTIEYISVGDEKEDNRHLVNSDHIYTLHLKEVPGRSTEALEQLQKENGTASVSLREARFREEFELLEARLREEFELREARLREELQEISSKVERKEIDSDSGSSDFVSSDGFEGDNNKNLSSESYSDHDPLGTALRHPRLLVEIFSRDYEASFVALVDGDGSGYNIITQAAADKYLARCSDKKSKPSFKLT